ncbi:MAG: glycosyl transferase, partial [Desulfovibrio sp.]
MKIDLHVHSKFSSRPTQWILKKIGCPESFMEPTLVYRLAKERGMDRVTITDHNTIDGALEIAHLEGTFISEEVTAHFPEDKCKTHVLVWDIDEAIHAELMRLRKNIYELVAYMQQEDLIYGIAHPLYAVNDKLTLEHVEKMMLLFPRFELNGTRDGQQNTILTHILDSLDQEAIEGLVEKHGIEPNFDRPWIKGRTGGSDDHSGIYVARMYTQVQDAKTLDDFFSGLRERRSLPRGEYSTPKTMAHNLYAIGYQFFRQKCNLGRFVNKDRFLKFLDRSLMAVSPNDKSLGNSIKAAIHRSGILKKGKKDEEPKELQSLLRKKAEEIFYGDHLLVSASKHGLSTQTKVEDQWYDFANKTANRALAYYADKILDRASKANIFDIFQTVASAGALYTALTPYFVGYGLFTKDRAFCRSAHSHFCLSGKQASTRFKLGHFTDTFFETNGVAKTLQEQVRMAMASDKDYTVITCDRGHGDV